MNRGAMHIKYNDDYDDDRFDDAYRIAYAIINDIECNDIDAYCEMRESIAQIANDAIMRYIDLHFEYCIMHDDDLNHCNARGDHECMQMQYDAYIIIDDDDCKFIESIAHMIEFELNDDDDESF